MPPPKLKNNPEDYLLFKHGVFYRLKESIRRQPNFEPLYRKTVIHRQSSNELPQLVGKKLIYLLYLTNHKPKIRLPNDATGINAIRHSKGLLSLSAKSLPTSLDVLAGFGFSLKSNSRSLKSFSVSFTKSISLSLSHNIQIGLNVCDSLGRLSNLETLDISFVAMDEELIQAFSRSSTGLNQLKSLILDFRSCSLTTTMMITLEKVIRKLRDLQAFKIALGPIIEKEEKSAFFFALSQATNLHSLCIETRRAVPRYLFESLVQYLQRSHNLKKLSISFWNSILTQDCLGKIFNELDHLELENFSFGMNNLVDSESIFSKLAVADFNNLKSLKLDLINSRITSNSFFYLGESLPESLETLDLKFKNVNIDQAGIPGLLHKLKTLNHLKQLGLDLNLCNIDDQKLIGLVELFPEKSKLQKFGFSAEFNSLGDESIIKLANKIKTVRKLQELKLDLKGNSISKVGLFSLVNSFKALNKLSDLTIDLQSSRCISESLEEELADIVTSGYASSLKQNQLNLSIFV